MKKILAIITLLAVLTVCMTSCGKRLSGMTAETAYNEMRKSLADAEQYVIVSERTVTASGGEAVSSERSTYKKHGNNLYIQNVNASDPMLSMECWYVRGMSYSSYPSMKVKAPIPEEEYLADSGMQAMRFLPELSTELFDGKKFMKDDGKHYVAFSLSEAQYLSITGDADIGGEITGEVTLTVYFDENATVTSVVTSYSMTVSSIRVLSETVTTVSLESSPIEEPQNSDEFKLIG